MSVSLNRKLCVVLLTYMRTDYAHTTLQSTFDNLIVPPDIELHVHVADDGSPDLHRTHLVDLAKLRCARVTVSNSERGGYGRNYNLATQITHEIADYFLMLEDDWELVRPLYIGNLIADMEACESLQCIRLGYLSHTQPLRGEVLTVGKHHNKYLLLDSYSPEPHVFAGHPRLETFDFQRSVGEWPEGLTPGETEFMVAHYQEARNGVAWPMDLVKPLGDLYCHIGTVRSY